MYECGTCTAAFWCAADIDEHLDRFDHNWPECETCTRTFDTEAACQQHMNSKSHWAPRFRCETCSKKFLSTGSAAQHMTAVGHWLPRIPCEKCSLEFTTRAAADQHMKEQLHYRNYCGDCGLRFQNANNLHQHLNSSIHRGREFLCPFCKSNYTTASGLAHHLETGSCAHAPTLNRETILRIIRERDPGGVITTRQIEWYPEDATYSATDRAFNGHSWECYLCHRTFGAKHSLNAHLNSPVHKQKVYRCPNAKARCGKEFISLAGLFNHLESESCSFMRFEKVQKQMQGLIQGQRLISFSEPADPPICLHLGWSF